MSKQTRKFFEALKDGAELNKAGEQLRSMGVIEAAKEGVKVFALGMYPGLANIGAEVKQELKEMGAHGAHEMAAALFNGSPFVMYPRGHHDDQKKEEQTHVERLERERDQGREI